VNATVQVLPAVPDVGPARHLQAEVDAPPEWRRRAGDDSARWTLHGLAWGDPAADRPAVVLVHGLVVAARMVAPTAERLSTDGLVVAPELPGSGRSDKPRPVPHIGELGGALAAWLEAVEQLRCRPVVLVGNSVGAQVALDATARLGDRVAGVVLASPVVDRSRRRWRSQIPRWLAEQRTQSRRLRRVMLADNARGGATRLVRTFASSMREVPEERIRRIKAPVLVVQGTTDPLVSRQWCEALAERAPDGRLAVIPGAVHAMAHDNPVELARVVRSFVADLEPAVTDRRAG
jgi:pimeloyl-ACP methyl ester carboxylesterase